MFLMLKDEEVFSLINFGKNMFFFSTRHRVCQARTDEYFRSQQETKKMTNDKKMFP